MKIRLLLLLLILPFLGFSQYSTLPDSAYDKLNGDLIISGLIDVKDVAISPFKWDKKEWMIAGGTVVLGAILYKFDGDIQAESQKFRGSFTNNLSKYVFDPYGETVYPAIIFAGMYFYGLSTKDFHTQSIALNAAKTVAIAGLVGFTIKQLTGRQRPNHGDSPDPRAWSGPFKGEVGSSFPSMHTATAFATASFLSSAYPNKKWIGVSTYSMAALVGLSRLNDDRHWASDVLFGAVIGYGIGKLVHSNMLKRANIKMLPVSRAGLGITLIKEF